MLRGTQKRWMVYAEDKPVCVEENTEKMVLS